MGGTLATSLLPSCSSGILWPCLFAIAISWRRQVSRRWTYHRGPPTTATFQVLNECLSTKTQQQYVAQYLGENADKNGEVSLSRLHGPRMKFPIAFQKNAKTIISHDTMLKIKKEINLSGNKSIILSQMLTTETDGLKLEKYFKQAVIDMPKKVKEYFDFTTVEMDVYDQVDFQYWRLSRGNLIAKNGQNHSEDIIVTLPDVGKPGLIQDIHSGQVLTLKMNGQVIFSDKIKIVQKTHTTRSAKKIISLRASKSGTYYMKFCLKGH